MLLDVLGGKRREPAECRIKVADVEIGDLYPCLTEVTVEVGRTASASATLNFESRRDENGEWLVQDAGILGSWKSITIEAMFGDDPEEVFNGYIKEINVSYPESGSATVSVVCQDKLIALDREHHRTAWGNKAPTSDAEIFGKIL
ncbi:MAG: hypothetical protein Q9M23_01420, partial [Mariprofundaceae bacterium]|nr:hypothetical protein [Mariprofundaceae bacterium]